MEAEEVDVEAEGVDEEAVVASEEAVVAFEVVEVVEEGEEEVEVVLEDGKQLIFIEVHHTFHYSNVTSTKKLFNVNALRIYFVAV